jgi:NADH-quinone oxidoreductase subunit C
MTPQELKDNLLPEFSEEIIEIGGEENEPQLILKKEGLYNVVEHLKSRGYNYLSYVTAVDNQKDLSVLYRLGSPPGTNAINIKVSLPKASPKIESLASLFRGANWLEREVFDLFGIKFENHPDLRRIVLPEDWEGYPLRKTYSHPEIEKRPRMF